MLISRARFKKTELETCKRARNYVVGKLSASDVDETLSDYFWVTYDKCEACKGSVQTNRVRCRR